METASAVVERIVTLAIGTSTGANTNVFESRLPNQPDIAISVRAMGGAKSDRAFGETLAAIRENPDIQMLVRHTTIDGVNALVNQLRTAFDFKTWTATGGEEFFTEFSYQPVDMGEDENQREVRSIVMDIKRTRA